MVQRTRRRDVRCIYQRLPTRTRECSDGPAKTIQSKKQKGKCGHKENSNNKSEKERAGREGDTKRNRPQEVAQPNSQRS